MELPNVNNNCIQYIYIIHTSECISQKLSIYKIGKTKQELTSSGRSKRCNGYPKGSIQLALFAVSDCDKAEKMMIKNLELSDDIKHSPRYGSEYFEGQLDKICTIALSTALLYTINPIDSYNKPPNEILNNYNCKYCNKICNRKYNIKKHLESCKEQNDIVRSLELMLDIPYCNTEKNKCRFCNKIYGEKYTLTKHIKICKAKEEYKIKLEENVKLLPLSKSFPE
jgi:hypothetical protein